MVDTGEQILVLGELVEIVRDPLDARNIQHHCRHEVLHIRRVVPSDGEHLTMGQPQRLGDGACEFAAFQLIRVLVPAVLVDDVDLNTGAYLLLDHSRLQLLRRTVDDLHAR